MEFLLSAQSLAFFHTFLITESAPLSNASASRISLAYFYILVRDVFLKKKSRSFFNFPGFVNNLLQLFFFYLKPNPFLSSKLAANPHNHVFMIMPSILEDLKQPNGQTNAVFIIRVRQIPSLEK